MTFGIDISTHQAGLDLKAARAAGAEFVIVKSVASYLPDLTVADDYTDKIDETIDAGLGHAKGHYAVPNSQNTPAATAEFQMEIAHRREQTDVFLLDNEPLDKYPVYWRDDDAADYFIRLYELGARFPQMWFYCPADLTRRSGPWPRIEELRQAGLRVHWVSYGPNYPGPTGMVPDHEPYLGTAEGRITGWDVHQFTSNWRIPGYSGRIDGNYSPLSVGELFGGVDVGYLEARPAKGNMNQGFGPRPRPTPTSPAIHYGQDYGWGGGDAIYAARGGRVASYASSGAYGNRLIIDHGNGRQTWYCHLASAVVGVGAQVSAGQQVAWMGATGNVTAKHLHFELRINGVASDPEPYFATSSTAGGTTTTPIDNKQEEQIMGLPHYHWAPNRGGVLITESIGPIFPPNAEFAQAWKEQFPAPGGTDITTRKWDVLVQSARDRKALYEAITAAASPAVDVSADDIAKALAPQVIAGVVGEIGESNGATAAEVEEITNRVVRRVFGDAASA